MCNVHPESGKPISKLLTPVSPLAYCVLRAWTEQWSGVERCPVGAYMDACPGKSLENRTDTHTYNMYYRADEIGTDPVRDVAKGDHAEPRAFGRSFSWLGRKKNATYVEKKYRLKTSLAVVGLAWCSVFFSCTRRLKRAVKGHANTSVRRKSVTYPHTFPSRFPLFYRELRPLYWITLLFFTLKIQKHTR